MAFALIVLAIGSVTAGWIGIPHALGGHNQLQAWLEPAFEAPVGAEVAPAAAGEVAEGLAATSDEAREDLELTLAVFSTIVAVIGVLVAYGFWFKRRDLADAAARRFAFVHRVLLNKYYVDEVYDATIVQPIKVASQEGLWRWFDVRVIDGAVNGTGAIVDGSASVLRRLQTGSVRVYAGSLFFGVVVILGYYIWR